MTIFGASRCAAFFGPCSPPRSPSSRLLLPGCSSTGPRRLRISTDDAAVLGRGAALFAEHGAVRQGRDLEGEPDWRRRRACGTLPAPPHDATGHTRHHADADRIAMTRHGIEPFAPPGYRSNMPAVAGILAEAEIRAVIACIESRWPEEIRRRRERLTD